MIRPYLSNYIFFLLFHHLDEIRLITWFYNVTIRSDLLLLLCITGLNIYSVLFIIPELPGGKSSHTRIQTIQVLCWGLFGVNRMSPKIKLGFIQ